MSEPLHAIECDCWKCREKWFMNKFIVITLPFLWLSYCFFHEHQYGWIFRSLLGLDIGYVSAYLWKYNDLRNELLKMIRLQNDTR